ncbi:adenosylcobalamin-dependent ribonucleoside-diphosphate reductase [Candidatus Daviesbacteria bacterium]|nr:adenosylcobalamin-dependent ribonucleoside-diphosphate reductase [Candidatus Daviesbacteria bacterium]
MRKTRAKNRSVNLQVSVGVGKTSLTNGKAVVKEDLKLLADINSRTFETRLEPRYDKIPALPKGLPVPVFSESSQKVLKERYLLKGEDQQPIETIEERFWNLAYDVASGDLDFGASKKDILAKAKQYFTSMVKQEFLPNSPTIMNAGKQNGLQYSACFVLPIDDSLIDIFDSVKYAALIHQTGGGTGFAFSRLRPSGSGVKTTGGVASGSVSFLRVFNAATESIKQGGTRRGANMGILRIDHPDIMEFINCKAELDFNNQPVFDEVAPLLPSDTARSRFKTLLLDRQISNFNISCAVTDKFMEAYEKGEDYDLIDPRDKKSVGKLNAQEVFDTIIDRAWQTGDPGLVFIDRINHSTANPVPELEEIESTNPCGEQPLAAWDACNLGSINLGKFVFEDGLGVDWERLGETVNLAVDFLDNVVQTNPYTLREVWDEVHKNRRIGLGVMGWADMLFRLKIPYDSEGALLLAEQVMGFINTEGHGKSQELAKIRGAFPNFPYSIYKNGKPLRNSTVTTIAPTGTISIIGDCSSGVEPDFALAYIHRAKTHGDIIRTLTIANQTFEDIAKKEGFWSEELAQKVLEHGSVDGLAEVPLEWQRVFVTAPQIAPTGHVKMQAAFQKSTDNGVSKTINLPSSATREDVKQAYLTAWEMGCLGITVYRDGSKGTQVLNVSSTLKKDTDNNLSAEDTIGTRPIFLRGRTYKINTPVGEAFITVNRDNQDQPFEVFITIGKAGMHTGADAEAIGRMISLALRISRENSKDIAQKIISQLQGIGGTSQVGFGKQRVMSLADAVAKALAEDLTYNGSGQSETVPLNLTVVESEAADPVASEDMNLELLPNADLCPECGQATFVYEEGCRKCHSCGYSLC